MATVPPTARVVVIGAGIVGNSLVHHLARLGWRDIVQLDKGPLPNPGGSTGHASNFIFPVDHSREITDLTLDSVRQYKEMGVFTESGGFELARTEERMEELRRRMSSARAWGIEAELVSPDFVKEKVPFIETDQFIGAFWTPSVGVVDSLRAGTIMRERALETGALTVVPTVEVVGLDTEADRVGRRRITRVRTTEPCSVRATCTRRSRSSSGRTVSPPGRAADSIPFPGPCRVRSDRPRLGVPIGTVKSRIPLP